MKLLISETFAQSDYLHPFAALTNQLLLAARDADG